MTDIPAAARPHEDRVLPAVVYGLYLLSLPSVWFCTLIGLVVAYANRDSAGPRMKTHYEFLIQTFWKSIWWFLIGVALIIVGIPLSLVLIGIPVVAVGAIIVAVVHLWFYARAVVGLIFLAQDEPYPRPQAWLF
ncbi:MAG: DUF4870 family protein [Pseudomonadota bacterium]